MELTEDQLSSMKIKTCKHCGLVLGFLGDNYKLKVIFCSKECIDSYWKEEE